MVHDFKTDDSISILTPTYKGRERLITVKKCIEAQTKAIKEWIIVVDGCDESTINIANNLEIENVKIIVIGQEHGHKKTALNLGLKYVTGKYVFIADDDDEFPPDAIEKLFEAWDQLSNSEKTEYIGVTGLCGDADGNVIGDYFPKKIFRSNALECSLKYRVKGEKWGFLRTNILKKYPFFEDAEGYIGEGTVWFAIARQYKTLYVNQIVRTYNYNPDSIINAQLNGKKINANCQAYTYGYKDNFEKYLDFFVYHPRYFFACGVNYQRFLFHSIRLKKFKNWMYPSIKPTIVILNLVCIPLSIAFFINDILNLK